MLAETALRSGNLDEALARLTDEVKKAPGNAEKRVFLFQLLAAMGQWDRALTQLAVVGEMSAKAQPMAQMYREAIRCELLRAEVFAGKKTPVVFGKPAEWIALLLESLRQLVAGNIEGAESLRDKALEGAPTTAGVAKGQAAPPSGELAFSWIADADSRLGPMLEAIVNGRYCWIPFDRLHRLVVEKPTDLRDFVWAPAHLTFANGGEFVALIPTRYPGSEAAADGALRLARRTDWQQQGAQTYLGLGQRMLSTDQGELPILDLDLRLEGKDDAPAADADAGAAPAGGGNG